MPHADAASRILAHLIDAIIIIIVSIILVFVVGLLLFFADSDPSADNFEESTTMEIFTILSFVIAGWGYLFLMERSSGQTLGKKVLDIKAVQENYHPLTDQQAALRNGARLLWVMPILFDYDLGGGLTTGILGLVIVLVEIVLTFVDKRQTIADRVAKTRVVSVKAQPYYPGGPYHGDPYGAPPGPGGHHPPQGHYPPPPGYGGPPPGQGGPPPQGHGGPHPPPGYGSHPPSGHGGHPHQEGPHGRGPLGPYDQPPSGPPQYDPPPRGPPEEMSEPGDGDVGQTHRSPEKRPEPGREEAPPREDPYPPTDTSYPPPDDSYPPTGDHYPPEEPEASSRPLEGPDFGDGPAYSDPYPKPPAGPDFGDGTAYEKDEDVSSGPDRRRRPPDNTRG